MRVGFYPRSFPSFLWESDFAKVGTSSTPVPSRHRGFSRAGALRSASDRLPGHVPCAIILEARRASQGGIGRGSTGWWSSLRTAVPRTSKRLVVRCSTDAFSSRPSVILHFDVSHARATWTLWETTHAHSVSRRLPRRSFCSVRSTSNLCIFGLATSATHPTLRNAQRQDECVRFRVGVPWGSPVLGTRGMQRSRTRNGKTLQSTSLYLFALVWSWDPNWSGALLLAATFLLNSCYRSFCLVGTRAQTSCYFQ